MATQAPTGVVTLVFTDIESSSELAERHRGAFEPARAEHYRLLREAVERWQGMEAETAGDSLFAVFERASDAVRFAVDVQLALAQYPWSSLLPDLSEVRVRIGMHTGEPFIGAEQGRPSYHGPVVNRAARVSAAAHGGQILISDATRLLAQSELRAEIRFADLGVHGLKGVGEERLWQVCRDPLPRDFPPLKTLQARRHNLPVQTTSFIGREKEMAAVKALLISDCGIGCPLGVAEWGSPDNPHSAIRNPQSRLVTLTGSGGTGKTRLMLQVAADLTEEGAGATGYPDGIWLVELAAVSDPALAPQAVARVLGVRETGVRSLVETLTEELKTKRLLLLLDNCEHLLDACTELVDRILRSCPEVTVFATSREGLGISGEQTFRVPSLSLPPEVEGSDGANSGSFHLQLARSRGYPTFHHCEAVRLFADRAALVKPGFAITAANAPAVARLCRRLDGVPLALELAAARVRAMPVEQIEARLHDRFRLLTGGSRTALPRQQTLRALIDWSYDLLNEPERALLARLSVFSGGWTLEAAESVCGECGMENAEWGSDLTPVAVATPPLHRVERGPGGEVRTPNPQSVAQRAPCIPQYEVLDLLTSLVDKSLVLYEEPGGVPRYRLLETVRQYAREKLAAGPDARAARRAHRDYFLSLAEEANEKLQGPEQGAWMERLDGDLDNLRAALEWCAEDERSGAEGLRLIGALQRCWHTRGYWNEGQERSRAALDHPGAQQRTKERAQALGGAGNLAWALADYEAARRLHEEALAIRQEVNDRRGVAYSLGTLGNIAQYQADFTRARRFHTEALAIQRKMGHRLGEAYALNNLGNAAFEEQEFAAAQAYFDEALSISRAMGDRTLVALALSNMGVLAGEQGRHERARACYEESIAIRRALGDRQGLALALANFSLLACEQRDDQAAEAHLPECLRLCRELGDRRSALYALRAAGDLAQARGDLERAARLRGATASLREAIGVPLTPSELAGHERRLGELRAALGEEAFEAAFAAGGSLSWEQATTFALREAASEK